MEAWRRISWGGILLGNGALLIDCFLFSIPNAVMIPILTVAIILVFAGFIMRKRNTK